MMDFGYAAELPGKTLVGSAGERLGTIDSVLGGAVSFAAVQVGESGAATSFVPLAGARLVGDSVTVPYSFELVKAAPRIEAAGKLERADEQRIYLHYGLAGPDPTDGDSAGVDDGDRDSG